MINKNAPDWLKEIQQKGLEPYIATSQIVAPHLNRAPFGTEFRTHYMEDTEEGSFLEAYMFLETYLLSNALSFESPNLKMPHWVLIDCVLMQTAVVGFTAPIEAVPDEILAYYKNDPAIDLGKLSRLPISGQICATNFGDKSLTGISLFSLGKSLKNYPGKLGFYTKMLALEVYRARSFDYYYGIAQYNNLSLKVHGKFSSEMEVYQPTVMLHPGKEMTFIYRMKPDYDPYHPDARAAIAVEPSFWLNAVDKEKKRTMRDGIKQGKRYILTPPFSVRREDGVYLPIIEKDA